VRDDHDRGGDQGRVCVWIHQRLRIAKPGCAGSWVTTAAAGVASVARWSRSRARSGMRAEPAQRVLRQGRGRAVHGRRANRRGLCRPSSEPRRTSGRRDQTLRSDCSQLQYSSSPELSDRRVWSIASSVAATRGDDGANAFKRKYRKAEVGLGIRQTDLVADDRPAPSLCGGLQLMKIGEAPSPRCLLVPPDACRFIGCDGTVEGSPESEPPPHAVRTLSGGSSEVVSAWPSPH
jgi:hypothetical protein